MRPLMTSSAAPRLPHRWALAYAAFWTAIGLLLSVAALQDYHRGGGTRDWEPFLWEFSSVLFVGPLGLGVYAWTERLRGQAWWRQLPGHLGGAVAFSLLHVAGMFGVRLAVYGALGLPYETGPLGVLLVYEGAKDMVGYATLALLAHGLMAWRAAQDQAQELERTRRELAEARLARLGEQIQPHFLFNSLNLISSVMYEDVERADRLLCELAALLRQSLDAHSQGEHTLDRELALVQPFLSLMQARFGERLTVRVAASAEARACTVPALLLLAPVENAIKHDVARHGEAVTVSLCAERVGARLRIRIDNSGVSEAGPVDGGLGLRNLRERLAARYGDASRVDFGPMPAGGMRLQIELPA